MPTITKEEELIIRQMFLGKVPESDLEVIKVCVMEVKKGKGIYREVAKCGADLHESATKIAELTGLHSSVAGILSGVLWGILRSKADRVRRIKIGITKATWGYEAYLCKHPLHDALNGREFSIIKGARIGFFSHIHPGELVGCSCISESIIPL